MVAYTDEDLRYIEEQVSYSLNGFQDPENIISCNENHGNEEGEENVGELLHFHHAIVSLSERKSWSCRSRIDFVAIRRSLLQVCEKFGVASGVSSEFGVDPRSVPMTN